MDRNHTWLDYKALFKFINIKFEDEAASPMNKDGSS